MKNSINDEPCSCGSGKSYKSCCMKKKYTNERYQRLKYTVEDVPFEKARIVIFSDNTTPIGVKLLNEEGTEIKTSIVEVQGLYKRSNSNKSDKITYTIPVSDEMVLDPNNELSKYDMILVVDTSYDPYANIKIAFTSILVCLKEKEYEDAYGNKEFIYKKNFQLLEWDATQCNQIENYMYTYAIEFLRTKYKENNILLKTAVIIDSCLGSIPLYNERKEPIFESYYLPDGFFIFYASDKGDKIQNKLMKECNSEAQKALKEYKESLSSENTKC